MLLSSHPFEIVAYNNFNDTTHPPQKRHIPASRCLNLTLGDRVLPADSGRTCMMLMLALRDEPRMFFFFCFFFGRSYWDFQLLGLISPPHLGQSPYGAAQPSHTERDGIRTVRPEREKKSCLS